MTYEQADVREAPVDWTPVSDTPWRIRATRVLVVVNVVLAIRYLTWLLAPGRPANVLLYVLLVGAEVFNLVQGAGFWWTLSRLRRPVSTPPLRARYTVDVFIPTYNEPVDVVELTVAAATRLTGAEGRVALLDDGDRPEMEDLARRYDVRYIARPVHDGAKAGNVNWAMNQTDAPFVAILDCDHVADPEFLEVCLAHLEDPDVAFVQTPQYYANWRDGGIAEATWSQQALFFGTIAVGRDAMDAMFCCGTNVVFRRVALESAGGFSPDSLTEDFELSIRLHEQGWRTVYVPEVLARGLGPEDMGSYVSQQLRWARGCLAALPRIVMSRLPFRIRLQYLLSAAYWLTGWTLLIYMSFPVVRILTGEQPVQVASADQFLLHWAPYFIASMATVALTSRGRYTYSAFALMSSIFWVHIVASVLTLLRRKGSFAVTPKRGTAKLQLRPILAPLVAITVLVAVAVFGLVRDTSPATVTIASFAFVHVAVLLSGIRFAIPRAAIEPESTPQREMVA